MSSTTISLLNSSLNVIFFIHLVFTSWGLQSDWAPTSYFFYNLIFLLVLLWSVHQQESAHAVTMAFFFNIICIFLDVVNVGVFFPSRSGSTSRRFSAGMAIVNMLMRPVTTFFLYKIIQERQAACYGPSAPGGVQGIFGTGNDRRGQYQDIGASPVGTGTSQVITPVRRPNETDAGTKPFVGLV